MKATLILAASLALVSGCAGNSTRSSAVTDRNHITREEVQASTAPTALALVQQLRPRWLSERGVASVRASDPVILYVDDTRTGEVGRLSEYSLEHVSELKFLDAINATQRFGIGHRSGAIMLYLRRGK